jgi:hypothetical protein
VTGQSLISKRQKKKRKERDWTLWNFIIHKNKKEKERKRKKKNKLVVCNGARVSDPSKILRPPLLLGSAPNLVFV